MTGECFDDVNLKTQANLNAAGMIESRRQLHIHATQLFALAPWPEPLHHFPADNIHHWLPSLFSTFSLVVVSTDFSQTFCLFHLSLVGTESSHIAPSRPEPEFPDNRKVLRATEKEKSPLWFISCREMMRESDAFSGNLRGNKNSQPGDSPNLFPLTFSFFFF